MNTNLQEFLIDDLKKVEHHVNEIIENIYASGQKKEFEKDIEEIEMFFSYWRIHAQFKEKQEELIIQAHHKSFDSIKRREGIK